MMGLPVAVFLHNRFSGSPLSFLFFFPRLARPSSPLLRRRSLLAGPYGSLSLFLPSFLLSLFARSSSPSSALPPISPYVGNVHTPRARRARARVQLAGGCILITFMSSDIPARFIAPAPADSAKTRHQPPSFRVPPFLRSPPRSSRAPLLRFSRLRDHP